MEEYIIMNLTEQESIRSLMELTTNDDIKEADFELDENLMFKLTKKNAEKALKCIRNNHRYKAPSYEEYYKSQGKSLDKYTLGEWENIIRCIARANSTRTSNENIKVMAKYIFGKKDAFLNLLKSGDHKLVDEITSVAGYSRHEKSLASKVCHFLCELEYGKSDFPINDNIVRNMLPYYLNYFKIGCNGNKLENSSYQQTTSLISKVKDKLPENLTYSEIDRIIWYCYRNDSVRREIAIGELRK